MASLVKKVCFWEQYPVFRLGILCGREKTENFGEKFTAKSRLVGLTIEVLSLANLM